MKIDRRHETFINVTDMACLIADGNLILSGNVENVSFNGLKVSGLQKSLSQDQKGYSAVVSSNYEHHRLVLIPRWLKENGCLVDIGFEIAQGSDGWTKFVWKELMNIFENMGDITENIAVVPTVAVVLESEPI